VITVHYNPSAPRMPARESMLAAYYASNQGQNIETSCDLFMLVLMQRVRHCDGIGSEDIRFTFEDHPGVVVQVDTNGDLIQPWPDDLFELRFKLQFSRDRQELEEIVRGPGKA